MGSGWAGLVADILSGLADEHCVESSSEVVEFESVYNDRLTVACHSVHIAPTPILLGFGCSDLPADTPLVRTAVYPSKGAYEEKGWVWANTLASANLSIRNNLARFSGLRTLQSRIGHTTRTQSAAEVGFIGICERCY